MITDLERPKRLFILFLLCIFVFVIVLVAYDIIFVEKMTSLNNLEALPNVKPQDLPDAEISLSSCITDLKTCTSDVDCEDCSENNKFKCTNVERTGQFEINGIKVEKGNWCLPKPNVEQRCNKYTGKWVWTTSADCPPDENGVYSSQCWKCMCLYPDLFYDEKDCSTQIACINTSDKTFQTPEEQVKRNRLIGASYSQFSGQYWDPTMTEEAGDSVLNVNPYSTDDQGRPLFYCECDTRDASNNTEFLRLPNDPYSCHVDMCYNVNQKLSTTYSCVNSANQPCDPYATPNDCVCSCNCKLNSTVTRSDGTCQVVAGLCNPGAVNDDYSGCNCGRFQKRICRSNQKNQSNTALPQCRDQENPFGEECVDPCDSTPCGPNAICSLSDTDEKGYFCRCDFPYDMTDAQGMSIDWKTADNEQTCDPKTYCAYGSKVYYGRQGYRSWSQGVVNKDGTPPTNNSLCGQLKCCIPGKYMFEWNNDGGSGNDQAWIRCLRPDEAHLKVGDRDSNTHNYMNGLRIYKPTQFRRPRGWLVVDSCDYPWLKCKYQDGYASSMKYAGVIGAAVSDRQCPSPLECMYEEGRPFTKSLRDWNDYFEPAQCCPSDTCAPGGVNNHVAESAICVIM